MIKGKTSTGFEYEIDPAALDNMELVDAIAEADENHLGISKVIRLLLGEKQRDKLYNHLRTEKGTVPVAAVSDALLEIFKGSGQRVKN